MAESSQLEVLRHGQGIHEGDLHPFARLVEGVDVAGNRQIDRRGGDQREVVPGARDNDRARGARRDLGHAVELGDRTGRTHALSLSDGGWAAAAEDEDALRCRGVGVGVGVLFFQEEALQLVRALEIGDDDAFHRHRGASQRRCGAAPLHIVDEGEGARRR